MRAPKLYTSKKPRKSRGRNFFALTRRAVCLTARLCMRSAARAGKRVKPADADFKQNAARKCAARRKYDSHSG